MELTKEQALEGHRKMWNWIADQYRQGIQEDIFTLKRRYILDNEREVGTIASDCYCCEYGMRKSESGKAYRDMCLNCPVSWGTECEGQVRSYCLLPISAYRRIKEECDSLIYDSAPINTEKCARLAMEIANLPEKECV